MGRPGRNRDRPAAERGAGRVDRAGVVPTRTLPVDRAVDVRVLRQRVVQSGAVCVTSTVVPDRDRDADVVTGVFLVLVSLPPNSTLFPYTTLFRSRLAGAVVGGRHEARVVDDAGG